MKFADHVHSQENLEIRRNDARARSREQRVWVRQRASVAIAAIGAAILGTQIVSYHPIPLVIGGGLFICVFAVALYRGDR